MTCYYVPRVDIIDSYDENVSNHLHNSLQHRTSLLYDDLLRIPIHRYKIQQIMVDVNVHPSSIEMHILGCQLSTWVDVDVDADVMVDAVEMHMLAEHSLVVLVVFM